MNDSPSRRLLKPQSDNPIRQKSTPFLLNLQSKPNPHHKQSQKLSARDRQEPECCMIDFVQRKVFVEDSQLTKYRSSSQHLLKHDQIRIIRGLQPRHSFSLSKNILKKTDQQRQKSKESSHQAPQLSSRESSTISYLQKQNILPSITLINFLKKPEILKGQKNMAMRQLSEKETKGQKLRKYEFGELEGWNTEKAKDINDCFYGDFQLCFDEDQLNVYVDHKY